MKKVISLLLSMSLLLSACGAQGTNSGETTTAPSSSVTESRESTADTAEQTKEQPAEAQTTEGQPAERTKVNFGVLAGPTGMGAAKLWDDSKNGKSTNDYTMTLFGAPTDVAPKLISKELDIAAVPTNLAAVLYQKTNGGVQLLALNTLGVLYLLTAEGESIHSIEDLKGKTVYSSGQAAVPEYVFNYILDAYGLKEEVTVIYEAEHDAVVAALAAGKAQIAVLPEPKVTAALTQVKGLSLSLDLTKEWESAVAKKGDGDCLLSMGCVVVRKAFAEEHPEAVAAFLKEYEASVNFMKDPANMDAAAALCEACGIIPKAAVAKKALPNCNLCLIAGTDMKTQIAPFYEILFGFNPAAVGGKLPDDAFYYTK